MKNSIKNPKVSSYSSITDVIRLLLGGVKGNRKVNERGGGVVGWEDNAAVKIKKGNHWNETMAV